jgi:hypothetical protein
MLEDYSKKCEVCGLNGYYHYTVLYCAEHKDIRKELVRRVLSRYEYLLLLLETNKNSDICPYLDETLTIIKHHYPELEKLLILV